jgi:uncharacterized protein YbjT (DUF2867 family)
MTKKVLVTGATGSIGGQLAPRLAAYGDLEVRAFVRDEGKAANLKAAGAELAVGTFENGEAVRAALDGIDTVVLITAPNPNAADQALTVLNAAKAAGVRKIVRVSALKAAVDGPTDNTRQHGRTDDAIQSSGLTYVILRPHFFMQNLFFAAQTVANDGTMYWGMGDGKLGMIDVRDIVDCVEKCVVSDAYDNQVFNPTGPESISFQDSARSLTEIMGKQVNYVPVPLEAVEQSIREMGMGDWFAKVMRDYSKAYSENWGDFATDDVQRITGQPARSFDAFAREVFVPALGQGN